MPHYNLSPSLIGRFFYHDCERYLRYHATPEQERDAAGIPPAAVETGPVTRALLEAGIRWEEEVVCQRVAGRVLVPDGAGPITDRSFSIEETFNLLPNLTSGEAIYQTTIPVSVHFLRGYGLDPEVHRFAPCRPDLILMDDRGRLQVIDIKASEELSISHRIQATLYALILDHALALLGLDLRVDLDHAAIWLHGQTAPEPFDLHLNIRVVEEFLRHRLPEILSRQAPDLAWHLTSRCESCEFYPYCRAGAGRTASVSLIPGLSTAARRYLREAVPPIETLPDLAEFLNDPKAEPYLDGCGSLAGEREHLQAVVRALLSGEVVPLPARSHALPVHEDIAIILTLQSDPVSGLIYALGFRRIGGREVYGTPAREEIHIAADPADTTRVRREFIRGLLADLEAVETYNRGRDWKDQRSLQTYVYDTYEEALFTRLLDDAMDDPDISEEALRLRFYYQDAGIAAASSHPETTVSYPLVVLTREIRRLLALPVPFSLRLPEVLDAIPSSRFHYRLSPGPLFWNEHNNAMKADAILLAWHGNRPEALDWIRHEVSRRLLAAGSVLEGLRERVSDRLQRWPERFRFPRPFEAATPEISRLLFITEYESFMGARRVQDLRSRPREVRLREGISIPVERAEGNFWRLLRPLDLAVFERSRSFSYLLVPEGEEVAFDDLRYRSSASPGGAGVAFARVHDTIVDYAAGLVKGVVLEVRYPPNRPPIERGVLHPRFTDFNAPRMIERLLSLDGDPENGFIRLLRDPRGFAAPLPALPAPVDDTGFTRSQERAFRHMTENRLTLVWGPPGTGKTHFLATAIVSLMRAQRLRVGVAGFTHAAVENLLLKVQGMTASFPVYKLREVRTPGADRSLAVLGHDRAGDLAGYPGFLIGGTVHAFERLERLLPALDLLVVDEASQMRPADLAMVFPMLSAAGRLVLAGDDLQLPPVIQGRYPAPEDGLPGLEDSIFAYLRHRDDPEDPVYTCQLLENWRMNRTLSLFPAETLYGRGYAPATEEVARRRIYLVPGEEEEPWLDRVIDPDYPLVLCVLEGVRTTIENRVEADLVARVAARLRERLIDPETGRPYVTPEFWHRGLFIVSPHHAQIGAIKERLAALIPGDRSVFVDTVDRMQGQEADAVIVSYGVSDVETALAEAEFIYSRNRLNVSLTRSRAKCIVFLPRPLLEPPLDVVSNDRSGRTGFSHMLDLQEFCREDAARFGLDEGVSLTVMRAESPRSPSGNGRAM
ncbi:bifunctional RecB family nuclease/DEAD/DEAH box helicase [Methanoculleus sp.]|uniref:bifunctional RecB family nuclease/DEAD/DEAH box helicase n=1 Tax=Methanoculleus sp. TaxID=90427 RepID=UPI0026201521|nr:AAA domain-containing protein [Methanoculleus sp.]MDI6867241.1 AAA domain-containing protein [Methanoculleus sp.]